MGDEAGVLQGCPRYGGFLGVARDTEVVEVAAVVLAPIDDVPERSAVISAMRNHPAARGELRLVVMNRLVEHGDLV